PEPEIIKAVLSAIAARASAELDRQIAETALSESEARFRVLIDNLPLAFHICDAEGRLILLNKAWELWIGRGREVMLGKTLPAVLVDGGNAAAALAEIREVAETGRTVLCERLLSTSLGPQRTALVCRFPIAVGPDAPKRIGTLLTDVAEIRAMEVRQAALER